MPGEFDPRTLPFLTRKMLSFEHGTTFSLRITSQARVASAITIRGLTREGAFTLSHTPTADSVISSQTFRIPDFPIMLSVQDLVGNFVQGQCYVNLTLMVNGDPLIHLISGYVYWEHGLSYPATNQIDPRPRGGELRVISSTDPAANVEISLSVPTPEVWRIIALRFPLVTDANAANRRVHVRISPKNSQAMDFFSNIDQAATLTRHYTAAHVGSGLTEADDIKIIIPIPDNLILVGDSTIATATTNRQVGDNFGVMDVYAETFFQPA